MPFSGPGGTGPAKIRLEQIEPKRFSLLEGFHFQREKVAGEFEVTPTALGPTDLTSVPFGLRWFVNSYGRHTLPALLHDCLIDGACARSATVAPDVPPTRSEADDIFLEALGDRGVPLIRRHLMWAAVTFNTRFSYTGSIARMLTILWIVMAMVGTALFFVGFFTAFPWALIVASLAPIPSAALWGSKWRAGVWFGYGIVYLVPAALVVHASFLVYWLAERVVPQTEPTQGPPSPRNF